MSTHAQVRSVTPMPRVALGVVVAIIVALVVNTGIAYGAAALLPHGTQTGLMLIAFGPLTALGVIAGTVGWALIRRTSARPRAVLRVLVPVVFAVSLIPGVVLLIVGNSALNVVGLWAMHLVVTLVTITSAGRVLPLPESAQQ